MVQIADPYQPYILQDYLSTLTMPDLFIPSSILCQPVTWCPANTCLPNTHHYNGNNIWQHTILKTTAQCPQQPIHTDLSHINVVNDDSQPLDAITVKQLVHPSNNSHWDCLSPSKSVIQTTNYVPCHQIKSMACLHGLLSPISYMVTTFLLMPSLNRPSPTHCMQSPAALMVLIVPVTPPFGKNNFKSL